jgi:hypothetical protein
MTHPVLTRSPAAREELVSSFEDTFASLANYFTLAEAADGDPDFTAATEIAEGLAEVVCSSDVDCNYYACTLAGPDLGSDEFFAAVGVGRDERQSVSGWDNPKLEVVPAGDGDGERPAILLITWLNGVGLDRLEEYVQGEDLAALERAVATLAGTGRVHGVQLCTDDRASKVQLTLSKRPGGVYAGVLTVSVET